MRIFFNEPSLSDLLDDPLTRIAMARDGQTRPGFEALFRQAARRDGEAGAVRALPELPAAVAPLRTLR